MSSSPSKTSPPSSSFSSPPSSTTTSSPPHSSSLRPTPPAPHPFLPSSNICCSSAMKASPLLTALSVLCSTPAPACCAAPVQHTPHRQAPHSPDTINTI